MNIRTFASLHQMAKYVTIPGIVSQIRQMASHPTPVTQPIVQHIPLVSPLHEISGQNRTIEDVFNDCLKLCEQQYKVSQEEIDRRVKELE